jgi:DNA-binding response OmpR family regulator
MRSTAAFGRLDQFHLEPELDVGRAVPRPYPARPFFEKRTESTGAAPTEVSFGPFRLLRKQFPLLEGDKPVPLGGRALELLLVLLERRRVGQQAGYDGSRLAQCFRRARQSHGAYVSAASASRDGGDGKRFIVSIPGRGYRFSSPAMPAHEN